MIKTWLALLLVFLTSHALAAGGADGSYMRHADNDLNNVASLQRGAKYYVNYCFACHSAKYVRYQRLAEDLNIDETMVKDNLMVTGDKIFDLMLNGMPETDATRWFGKQPPDLSLTARSRGTDWLFSYLTTFYLDDSKPLGVNNMALPGASMPHVLWELEGFKRPLYKTETDANGHEHSVFDKFETVTPGSMTAAEYDGVARDIVNFLAYIGEPAQLKRKQLGIYVMMFLAFLFLVTLALKKEIWKDVH